MSATQPAVNRLTAVRSRDWLIPSVLALCFLFSGVAALIYQIAWTRQFALVFGTSELAVATVLAAYMGGLAAGAWAAERYLPRVERPVLAYAAIELGIGAAAVFLVPALLLTSEWLLHAWLGDQPVPPGSEQVSTSLFYLVSAFIALAVPTMLMGATLPFLARYTVQTESQIGRRVGLLYATNTAGAVVGALVTAFWLLPELGLKATVWAGATVNGFVFLFAAVLARRASPGLPVSERAVKSTAFRFTAVPAPVWVLPLMLISGAVSFFHEVLWTRMLSHVLGSSVHAFGVMVASFLGGIAIGGAIGAMLARSRPWAVAALAWSQLGSAVTAAVAYWLLDHKLPSAGSLAETAFFAALVLMPLTLCIGMTYPLAVRVLADRAEEAAPASARVYAWNTVGAIVGALGAGFLVIPWLRFEGSALFAVALSAVLAVASIWLLQKPRLPLGLAITGAAALVIVLFRPEVPEELIRTSPLNIANHGRLLYYDVGRSASVMVIEQDGGLILRTNGLPEAMMETTGSAPRFSGEFWLSPLAVIARPQTESMLVVGYGGGVVLEGVPPSVKRIDVIEIEPLVIEANRATRAMRKRDPLLDPRVNIITNDARGALNLSNAKYDAIVSQPSHPWTAGASHLYTLEFMKQAREHLNEGGVFVQWMNIAFINESLLRSLTATLIEAFGEVRIYRPDPSTLVFLASAGPLELERAVASHAVPLIYAPAHYGRFGINVVEDLICALAVDGVGARQLAADAPLLTDDDNRMATATTFDTRQGLTADAIGRILAPYDPLVRPDSWIFRELRDQLAFDYIGRRLAAFIPLDRSTRDRLEALTRALGRSAEAESIRINLLFVEGRTELARQRVREAVVNYPESMALRYEYVRPFISQLAQDGAPPEVARQAALLTGSAAVVLQAGRFAANRQFEEVAKLDAALDKVPWTASWKGDAIQARVDWRTRVGNEKYRERYGDEALSIVDRAVVIMPTLAMYSLRARAAIAAGRADVLTESIWTVANNTHRANRSAKAAERAEARRNLEGLLSVLDSETQRGRGARPERVAEVREILTTSIEELARGS